MSLSREVEYLLVVLYSTIRSQMPSSHRGPGTHVFHWKCAQITGTVLPPSLGNCSQSAKADFMTWIVWASRHGE